MSKKKSKLQQAQDNAQAAISKTNERIEKLGEHTNSLFKALNDIQEIFDKIRNVPSEKQLQYEKLKEIRLNWKRQAEKIDKDYKNAAVKNAGAGAAGIGAGVAVAALGPTAAMGVATTFGQDYAKMTEAQQYELGAYVNLMSSSTQLLVNPILGLQPNTGKQI